MLPGYSIGVLPSSPTHGGYIRDLRVDVLFERQNNVLPCSIHPFSAICNINGSLLQPFIERRYTTQGNASYSQTTFQRCLPRSYQVCTASFQWTRGRPPFARLARASSYGPFPFFFFFFTTTATGVSTKCCHHTLPRVYCSILSILSILTNNTINTTVLISLTTTDDTVTTSESLLWTNELFNRGQTWLLSTSNNSYLNNSGGHFGTANANGYGVGYFARPNFTCFAVESKGKKKRLLMCYCYCWNC